MRPVHLANIDRWLLYTGHLYRIGTTGAGSSDHDWEVAQIIKATTAGKPGLWDLSIVVTI